MNTFQDMLAVGDLRSDGLANEVVRIVSKNIDLLPELMETFNSSDPAVRGHAADAVEKIARTHHLELIQYHRTLLLLAVEDELPMVRWHLATVLGYLAIYPETREDSKKSLLTLLRDRHKFVKSWAISSLAILALNEPESTSAIVEAIMPFTSSTSAAVAKRAQTAIRTLTNPGSRLPDSWNKAVYPAT